MFLNTKKYGLLCIKQDDLYVGINCDTLVLNDANGIKKYNNKALMLLDHYQFINIDINVETTIEKAKKIIGFKLKEYIDYPL